MAMPDDDADVLIIGGDRHVVGYRTETEAGGIEVNHVRDHTGHRPPVLAESEPARCVTELG